MNDMKSGTPICHCTHLDMYSGTSFQMTPLEEWRCRGHLIHICIVLGHREMSLVCPYSECPLPEVLLYIIQSITDL